MWSKNGDESIQYTLMILSEQGHHLRGQGWHFRGRPDAAPAMSTFEARHPCISDLKDLL